METEFSKNARESLSFIHFFDFFSVKTKIFFQKFENYSSKRIIVHFFDIIHVDINGLPERPWIGRVRNKNVR